MENKLKVNISIKLNQNQYIDIQMLFYTFLKLFTYLKNSALCKNDYYQVVILSFIFILR